MWFHCKPFLSVSVNSRIYLRKHLDYADESVITIKQTKTTKMSSFHQVSNKVNHKKLSMLLTREFGQPPLSSLFLHLRPHAPLLLLPRLPCPGSYLSPDGPSCSRAVLPRLLTDATTQLPSLTWASLKFLSIGSLPSASEYAMISLILRKKKLFYLHISFYFMPDFTVSLYSKKSTESCLLSISSSFLVSPWSFSIRCVSLHHVTETALSRESCYIQ